MADPDALALARALQAAGTLRSPALARAVAGVPRAAFVPPGTPPDRVYADEALLLTTDADGAATSSISQPSMVAVMLEQLAPRPGHRVLEVGTATGWTAALLAELVGPRGAVVSVELDPALAGTARARLARLAPAVRVVTGDGWRGAPADAPFDRVHVTVGVDDLSPRWVDQLADGGVLVAPLALRPGLELSVALTRDGDELRSTSVRPCGFVRLRGPHAGPTRAARLPDGATLLADGLDGPAGPQLRALLATAPADAGRVGPLPPGWTARLALEEPGALVVVPADRESPARTGLADPHRRGAALVAGDRLLRHGDPGAVALLRAQLARAAPLDVLRLAVTARLASAADPPGTWTVRAPAFTYGVAPG